MANILQQDNRFTLFPIKDNEIWEAYKTAEAAFWTVEEVDLSEDLEHFTQLSDDEQYFLKHILAFFAASDGIVNENLAVNMYNWVQLPEARCFYGFQIAMENIHSEMYSLLIDTYVKDIEEKNKLFNAISHYPTIKKKAEWALMWLPEEGFGASHNALIAFACVEGIFFSSSFCAIYWLKTKNLLPGLTFANELIARDEGMHTDFACLLYSKLEGASKAKSRNIEMLVKQAVEIEQDFVKNSLPVELIGMNSDLMCQYVEFVADFLLTNLDCPKIYNTKNPFPFMENISMENKTNFFERRVGAYQKKGVLNQDNTDMFSWME